MSEISPGPWDWEADANDVSVPEVPAIIYDLETSEVVADVACDTPEMTEVARANTYLIAAAPELLAAAEFLHQAFLDDMPESRDGVPPHQCEFVLRPDKGGCTFHEKWVDAEAAIKKARGTA